MLGFDYQWTAADRPAVIPDRRRAIWRVRKLLEEVIFDTVQLEDNPFTFPEVKTLLEGVTVGGHKLSDQQQVLNQADSWRRLFKFIESDRFSLSREIFLELHALVAFEEALCWGVFRDEQVSIAGTRFQPPSADQLVSRWDSGIEVIRRIADPRERSMVFFLFGAMNQFFFDGNKRSSRLMMNGELLSAGYDAINIPASRKLEFNQKMLRFYDGLEGSEMMQFLADCSIGAGRSA